MKIKIYIAFVVLLSLYSCNKWLTITPKGQVDASEMLTTSQGYNAALGGVYYILSSPQFYGKDLTYGMMDAMAQYWNIGGNTSHTYYKMSLFDYKDSSSKGKIDNIWKSYYKCIAQCNLIISNLEENRKEIPYSEIIEGEAYGLRAFCHLELFKLFGPVIRSKADLEKKAIAYRTNFDVTSLEFMTGNVVLEKVMQDLKKASELLIDDPINRVGRRGDANATLLEYNASLQRRGSRMNYYATIALAARTEQLRLNNDEAYRYADILIKKAKDMTVFTLMDKANMESSQDFGKDMNYSREMIFAIYIDDLWELSESFFGMNDKSPSANSGVTINPELYIQMKEDLYFREPDGSANDNRYRYWLSENPKTPGNYDFKKLYSRPNTGMSGTAYDPEIGIFQLSEAYYIACEAQIGKNNTLALELLNTVRRTRNLVDIPEGTSESNLREYLLREQRKNFIGDGLMFGIYKRLFAPIYVNGKNSIQPLESNFIWPIPDSEYEFSPNVKPKE